MILPLQSLRGIFALVIFYHHFLYQGKGVFAAGGDFGVSFFFMLSGFFAYLTHGSKTSVGTYGSPSTPPHDFSLIYNQLPKFFPLHILCFALTVGLGQAQLSEANLRTAIANLMLVQSWIPIPSVYFSFNSVSWFLSTLVFLYIIFPVIRYIISCKTAVAGTIILCLLAIYTYVCVTIPEHMCNTLIYIFPLMRIPDFLIGIIAGRLLMQNRYDIRLSDMGYARQSLIELIIIILSVTTTFLWYHITPRIGSASLWWIPCLAIIMVFSHNNGGFISRLICSRPLIYLGKISLPFYLLHVIIIRIVCNNVDTDTPIACALWSIFTIAITVIVSVIINHYYVIPIRNMLTKLLAGGQK